MFYTIVDNWYENPDQIRETALNNFLKVSKSGVNPNQKVDDYPGERTTTTLDNLTSNFKKFEESLGKKIDPNSWIFTCNFSVEEEVDKLQFDFSNIELKIKDTNLSVNHGKVSNGSFQYIVEGTKTWVHADSENEYAAVIYLTPDAPKDSGTGFYKLKGTDIKFKSEDHKIDVTDHLNENDWEMHHYIENVYNRCIIYDAKYYHQATRYFGKTLNDSRLTQVFFFNLHKEKSERSKDPLFFESNNLDIEKILLNSF